MSGEELTPGGLGGVQSAAITARVTWEKHGMSAKMTWVARMMVCSYFFNQAYTGLEIWWFYRQPFPYLNAVLLPASLGAAADLHLKVTLGCCAAMLLLAMWDSISIFSHQILYWITNGNLYINELMVKKFSLLGAVGLVSAQRWKSERRSSAVAGMLLEKAEEAMSDNKSIAMLVGRLLMSTLFLYVGYSEIMRQWNSVSSDGEGHTFRKRQAGDGHDNMWSKLIEFGLSLPFIVGWKTTATARMLALVLVLEAFISWSWWNSTMNIGYKIHAREHFTVNIGVAGGLIMLAFIGAGKYTMDNYLKKSE